MEMMQQEAPQPIFLKDYKPSDYLIDKVELDFDLGEEVTWVKSQLSVRRNASQPHPIPLVLDGEALVLRALRLDGRVLATSEYQVEEKSLRINKVPKSFVLEIETEIKPQENTALEGLYKSSGNFCTQCEAEGFRRITYFIDRPDVMARYSTKITANQEKYPVLLSNGNLLEKGLLPDGRHWVKWQDPHKKPCYLFALVAGDLVCQEDFFVTCGGRKVTLRIFVERMNADKCEHALRSLKKAMKWDEEVYGREYDLDVYMIVAVNDFNMGAMENKGLNIFNSKYVLAKPETATDQDYSAIEGVIAHEYFHNWTGNRITCRDWFQLSLKEGLTVFRDQCFSADMASATVQRINDVRGLRTAQFAEDAGPMAHPVRPESYMTINNFYTTTVYNKGAEVIRMIHQILGTKGFRLGMDLYFERHDGQAVTTDDFVKAMEDANGIDLIRFRNWYSQAGTPEVVVQTDYDTSGKTYRLTFQQSCKPSPNQPHKQPFHLPIAMGLLDPEGNDFPLQLVGEDRPTASTTRVLNLRKPKESYLFVGIDQKPVPSLLRGFSAPVKLRFDYSDEELAFLMANDHNLFNRWEAGQRLAIKTMLELVADYQQQKSLLLNQSFLSAFQKILTDPMQDYSLIAEILSLPSESYLSEMLEVINVEAIHHVREFVRISLAREFKDAFFDIYHKNREEEPYRLDTDAMAKRRLKNTSLSYLALLNDPIVHKHSLEQFRFAGNMTDTLGALHVLVLNKSPYRDQVLSEFYETWQADPLVVNKWFSVQALAPFPETMQKVKKLMDHPAFEIKNPNNVLALIGTFSSGNPFCFHEVSGTGYQFIADCVLQLDALNPQIAARLSVSLSRWQRYDLQRQEGMKCQLERIARASKLSKDVYEIVRKSLAP